MRQSGGSAEARVETLNANLESIFVHNPQADVRYRATRARYKPTLGESISIPRVQRCSSVGYETLVQAKVRYFPKWKENPEKVQQVIAKAAEE